MQINVLKRALIKNKIYFQINYPKNVLKLVIPAFISTKIIIIFVYMIVIKNIIVKKLIHIII